MMLNTKFLEAQNGEVWAAFLTGRHPELYPPDPYRLNAFVGQFNRMVARHQLFKKKYPDKSNAKGIPYTGLSNARPETKAIGAIRHFVFFDSAPLRRGFLTAQARAFR
jgi:hypothetical protein